MKRASWKGQFYLGNLVIPVKLYTATMPQDSGFTQIHEDDGAPIRRKMVCSQDGEELSSEDVVRAVEHNGRYVPIEIGDDVESRVGRDIIVRQFTDISHVHSLYFDKPYYLIADTGGEAAYAMLRNALKKSNRLAVVTYSLYDRPHIGVIGPTDGIMVLQQLKYATELVDPRGIKTPALPQPSPDQVNLAVRLIEKYTSKFHLEDYRNEYADAIHDIIERAIKGLSKPSDKRPSAPTTSAEELTNTLAVLLEGKEKTLS